MARRKGIKDRIGQAAMGTPGVNKKLLKLNRSFNEVKKALEKNEK